MTADAASPASTTRGLGAAADPWAPAAAFPDGPMNSLQTAHRSAVDNLGVRGNFPIYEPRADIEVERYPTDGRAAKDQGPWPLLRLTAHCGPKPSEEPFDAERKKYLLSQLQQLSPDQLRDLLLELRQSVQQERDRADLMDAAIGQVLVTGRGAEPPRMLHPGPRAADPHPWDAGQGGQPRDGFMMGADLPRDGFLAPAGVPPRNMMMGSSSDLNRTVAAGAGSDLARNVMAVAAEPVRSDLGRNVIAGGGDEARSDLGWNVMAGVGASPLEAAAEAPVGVAPVPDVAEPAPMPPPVADAADADEVGAELEAAVPPSEAGTFAQEDKKSSKDKKSSRDKKEPKEKKERGERGTSEAGRRERGTSESSRKSRKKREVDDDGDD